MCKFCVQHGKGKKWFHHIDNFEKKHLDDHQRLELSQAIYFDLAKEKIPASGFVTWYQVLFKGIPYLLKTPLVKQAIRPSVNRLVEQYHVGQVVTLEEASKIVDISGHTTIFDCWCRYIKGNNEACCMGIGAFGDMADDIPKLKYISVSPEKAKEIMELYEEKGCFHSVWTVKPPFISTICNCNNKVCRGVEGLEMGISSALHMGHQKASIDPHKCNGCGLCISVCPFDAKHEKDGLVLTDIRACFGCGLCKHKCPQGAIYMKNVVQDQIY